MPSKRIPGFVLTVALQPDFDIRSKEELLALLKRYQPRGGLPVKSLRESWPNVVPAIEDLEKQGKVLVIRAGGTEDKEGVLKMVYYDEIQRPEKVDQGLESWGRPKILFAALSLTGPCRRVSGSLAQSRDAR